MIFSTKIRMWHFDEFVIYYSQKEVPNGCIALNNLDRGFHYLLSEHRPEPTKGEVDHLAHSCLIIPEPISNRKPKIWTYKDGNICGVAEVWEIDNTYAIWLRDCIDIFSLYLSMK